MMINIQLNGKPLSIPKDTLLIELLQTKNFPIDTIAVAINEKFMPRSQTYDYILNTADRIEVLTAMQGG